MSMVAYQAAAAPMRLDEFDVEALDDATLSDRIAAAGDSTPCRSSDPEEYFPLVGAKVPKPDGARFAEEATRARDLCKGCPVVAECLELALRGHGPCGVWGARSEWERRLIRVERVRAERAERAALVGAAA